MNEDEITIGDVKIEFTYKRVEAEPEVGYLVGYWAWEVNNVYVHNDTIFDGVDILDSLSVNDLARIDEKIENYLNEK